MAYIRIKPENIKGLDVTLPVVFEIDGKQFVSLLHGRIDAKDTRELSEGESVEER